MRGDTKVFLLGLLVMAVVIVGINLDDSAAQPATAPATKPTDRLWPPVVHLVGEGGRAFGSVYPISDVPRRGDVVRVNGLAYEVVGVEWDFEDATPGTGVMLQGDTKIVLRRKGKIGG